MTDDHYLKRELYELVRTDPAIFDFLQAGSLDGIWYWDLERTEHEWMSPQFWEVFGYDPNDKEHLASEWKDMIHPHDLQVATDNFHAHIADPTHPYDQIVRYRHRNGATVWVRCRGLAVRDDEGTPIRMLGAHTDITEIQAAREFAESVMATVREPFVVLDDELRVVTVNPAFLRTFAVSSEETQGRLLFDLGGGGWDTLKPLLADERAESVDDYELTHDFPTVGRRTLSVNARRLSGPGGATGNILLSVEDITERADAMQRLRRSEERLTHALRAASLGMFDWDIRADGAVCTDRYHEVFGLEPSDRMLSEDDWLALVHPDDRPRAAEEVRCSMVDGAPYDTEYRVLWPDGSVHWVGSVAQLFFDDAGPYRMIGALAEITQRKTAEAELETKQRELEAANTQLEGFSYSVSHDLRAPLRAIAGFARAFQEDHGDRVDDDGRRMLGVIIKNTHKMSQLIDDLLAFSRLSRRSVEYSAVDMEQLARAAFDAHRSQEPERQIVLDLGRLPSVAGDSAMLRQVWTNLISNAIKYTRPRSKAAIVIQGYTDDGEARFSIRDNGVGFDARYTQKLFGVFQRLHKEAEFEGTGVGLALVHRIIERHSGRIWADSTIDEGATFEFAIPIEGATH